MGQVIWSGLTIVACMRGYMTDGDWYWVLDGGGMVCRDHSVAQILSPPVDPILPFPQTETLKPLVPYFSTKRIMYRPLPYAVPPHRQYRAIQSVPENRKYSEPVDSFSKSQAFQVSPTVNIVFYSDVTGTRLNFFSVLSLLHQLDAF